MIVLLLFSKDISIFLPPDHGDSIRILMMVVKFTLTEPLSITTMVPHGCGVYGSPISVSLTAGVHNIKVLYFENGGGECLDVRWRLGSGSTVTIPDSAFENNFVFPNGPNPPSEFDLRIAISFDQINLAWTDNSNDETGFELYRRAAGQSIYQLTGTPSANTLSFNDVGLLPSTTYYYKILSRNNNGVSNQPDAYLQLNNDLVDVGDNNLSSSLA
jgi:large repetitive protein